MVEKGTLKVGGSGSDTQKCPLVGGVSVSLHRKRW